jgi:PhzF family phenazine biosynthesis protein
MNHPSIYLVHVFAAGPNGGNPAPIVLGARGMSDDAMRDVVRSHGHESGFVLPAPDGSDIDLALRFWVPDHEMAMCGHATVGAVWLLDRLGLLTKASLRIHTSSGIVEALITNAGTDSTAVKVSQPCGQVETLDPALRADLASVLGTTVRMLDDRPIQNARTSRVKTLIPIASVEALDRLTPDFSRVQSMCDRIGSTGLYPYAINPEPGVVDARQFPQSSGYPEDAATGIAAAALAFGLLASGRVSPHVSPLRVRQGRAMGYPSEISVRFAREGTAITGCWIGGTVRAEEV